MRAARPEGQGGRAGVGLAKSPVALMAEIFRGSVPLLRSVTACAALVVPTRWAEKMSEPGIRFTPEVRPVPLSPTISGLVRRRSLLHRTSDARAGAPEAVGVKVTEMTQLASRRPG